MKMLRIIPSMDPVSGGPCQGLRNSVPIMDMHGIDTDIVCLDAPDAAFLANDKLHITALGPGKTSWSYTPLLKPWLLENLPKYDIVIVHGLWQYHGYAAKKAMQQLRRKKNLRLPKLYIMPHGMLDPYFQLAPERRMKAIRNRLYWSLIEGGLVNLADGVLFTCEEELQLARITFRPYHPKQELNVGYGIPEPPAYGEGMKNAFREKCPGLGDRKYLLFLSRIHHKKGVDLLLKAYAALVAENMDMPSLVVAGPGLETPYGQELVAFCNDNPQIKDRVFFPGMLSGDAKWGAFYGAEAFVLPSHQENFGIAVVEALSAGKPVLISRPVNIWREIEQGNAGLVESDDLAGCTSLLAQWLKKSNEEKNRMGMSAQYVYKRHFAVKEAAENMLNMLEVRVLQESGN